jgi:hypothetical protein
MTMTQQHYGNGIQQSTAMATEYKQRNIFWKVFTSNKDARKGRNRRKQKSNVIFSERCSLQIRTPDKDAIDGSGRATTATTAAADSK